MSTDDLTYPTWKTQSEIKLKEMNDARFLEYKYIKRCRVDPEKTYLWECVGNRKIDISCFYDYHQENRVVITDFCFNDAYHEPEVQVYFEKDIEEQVMLQTQQKAKKSRPHAKSRGKTLRVQPGVDIDNPCRKPLTERIIDELELHKVITEETKQHNGNQVSSRTDIDIKQKYHVRSKSPGKHFHQDPKTKVLLQCLYKKVKQQDERIMSDQKRIYDLSVKYGLAKRIAN